jgi:serine/threonine-protein kinase HipA
LVVYFLIGAIDGHAKNYSIEYLKKGHKLTPLYDILSLFPALTEKEMRIGKYKMALSVGHSNYYRADKIHRRHFIETAKICQLSEERANEIIDEVLEAFKNNIWEKLKLSKLFDHDVKDKIVAGIKIVMKKF